MNTHDTFLTPTAESEAKLLRDLAILFQEGKVAITLPVSYQSMAHYVRDQLLTLRSTMQREENHPFPRGSKGPIPEHTVLTEREKLRLNLELVRNVRTQFLNSFPKTAEVGVRCFNCDGKGFIVPLKATDATTLERWLQELRQPAEEKLPTYSSKGRGDGIFPERAEEGGASCSQ